MNDLTNMRIFRLLSEPSQQETNQEMNDAYGEFLEHIKGVSRGEDYATIHRTLNATRIELASLQTSPFYGQGEKCLAKSVFTKDVGNYQL